MSPVTQIGGFLKVKGNLEDVEAALGSAPIAVPGLNKLVEGVKLGHAWVTNVESKDVEHQIIELKHLEALVSEGQRIAVALPYWKVSSSIGPSLCHIFHFTCHWKGTSAAHHFQ